MSNNDFTSMQIILLTKLLHTSMHFLHAIPTAWKTLTQLANLHLSFTPQIRFTLILEFTTLLCATQLQLVPSCTVAAVTLYYSFKCPSPLFDHEQITLADSYYSIHLCFPLPIYLYGYK